MSTFLVGPGNVMYNTFLRKKFKIWILLCFLVYFLVYSGINLTHISAEVLAVAEDPQEVGDEEGAEHEDGWEQGCVGVGLLTPGLLRRLRGGGVRKG